MTRTAKGVSGGCQCGAVRYRVNGALTNAHLCHCRMCQKAAGNYFMPLANAQKSEFETTRGEISWFQSSDEVRRGFCNACGTPLIFDGLASRHLNVTLGSLDDPATVKPALHVGVESQMPWFGELARLPSEASADGMAADELDRIAASNHQHPDHDTSERPLLPPSSRARCSTT